MNEHIEKLIKIASAEVGTREDQKIIQVHALLNTKGLHGWLPVHGHGVLHLRHG